MKVADAKNELEAYIKQYINYYKFVHREWTMSLGLLKITNSIIIYQPNQSTVYLTIIDCDQTIFQLFHNYHTNPYHSITIFTLYKATLSYKISLFFVHFMLSNQAIDKDYNLLYNIYMIRLFKKAISLSHYAFSSKSHHQPVRPNETSVFFNSITSTIKGYLNPNYVVQNNPNLTSEEKATMKRFLVYKYDPSNPDDQPKYVSYYIDIKKIPPMYLDALVYIKDNLDSTLTFRRSCREGICGSCSMNCDGIHTLACIKQIDKDLTKPALITPLGHMFVLKDLVVDMTNFYTQYRSIVPYLQRKTPKKEGEKQFYQSIDDRKKLDGLYECILCACCSTSCPSYWWHPDEYLGPAVLLAAYRWIIDSRDQYAEQRLEDISKGIKLSECENIGMCTVTCPKGLDPQRAINELLVMVANRKYKSVELAV